MKEAVYIMMTVMGCLLMVAAITQMRAAGTCPDPFSCWLPALILFLGAVLSLFFGFVTFLIRDDPDVWR